MVAGVSYTAGLLALALVSFSFFHFLHRCWKSLRLFLTRIPCALNFLLRLDLISSEEGLLRMLLTGLEVSSFNQIPATGNDPTYVLSLEGSGCSKAVKRTSHNQKVVGSNPSTWWTFSSLSILSSVPRGCATMLIFLLKMPSFAARGKTSLKWTELVRKYASLLRISMA